MKKYVVFISMLVFCLSAIAEHNTKIDLHGKLPVSRSSSLPIEAFLIDNELTVNFLECVGNLTVEVKDENGATVFVEIVNTCTTGSVAIDIRKWNSGNYIIVISDSYGGMIEGGFSIP